MLASLLLLLHLTFPSFSSPEDSVGMERHGNRVFVLHRIDPGEDLYLIARRYNVSPGVILAENPSAQKKLEAGVILRIPRYTLPAESVAETRYLQVYVVQESEGLWGICKRFGADLDETRLLNDLREGQGLDVGQELLLRTSQRSGALRPVPETLVLPPLPATASGYAYHTVRDGESLFGIARKHSVPVDDLRRWNSIEDNLIKVGQRLIVGFEKQSQPANTGTSSAAQDNLPEASEEPLQADTHVTKSSIAERIDVEGNRRVALYNGVPAGTFITVFYESNGRSVVVRVIGGFPPGGTSQKDDIKLSSAAVQALGSTIKRFPVILTYMQEKDED